MSKNTEFDYLKENLDTFLNYMKEKYPLFNNSNIFLRDLQYGVKHFFELKDVKLSYGKVENITEQLIKYLENNGTLVNVFKNTWKLNYSKREDVTI